MGKTFSWSELVKQTVSIVWSHTHIVDVNSHVLRRKTIESWRTALVGMLMGHFQGPFLRFGLRFFPSLGSNYPGTVAGDIHPGLEPIPDVGRPFEVRRFVDGWNAETFEIGINLEFLFVAFEHNQIPLVDD